MADYYRFFPALYKADTLRLTLAEHGAYRRLLDEYMILRRALPDDDRALAALIGCTIDEWRAVAPAVRKLFRQSSGLLFQKRCDEELDWQDARARTRQEISAKGVEARRRKNNGLPTNGQPRGQTVGEPIGQPEERRGESIYKPPLRQEAPAQPIERKSALPEPGIKTAAEAVTRFAEARKKLHPDRKPLPPDQVRALWQQRVFKFAKTRLSDAEYQRLIVLASDSENAEGRAWMNRLSDEMRAVEAEAERRSATP